MTDNINRADDSGATIVCIHVAKMGYPILRADRDEPTTPEDTGWQFLCNSPEFESESEAQVWALSEILEYEPRLADFVDSPTGTILIRENRTSPWAIVESS